MLIHWPDVHLDFIGFHLEEIISQFVQFAFPIPLPVKLPDQSDEVVIGIGSLVAPGARAVDNHARETVTVNFAQTLPRPAQDGVVRQMRWRRRQVQNG